MAVRSVLRQLPGFCAWLLLVMLTTVAAVTGTNSLFYEGWGQPAWSLAPYLAPAAVLLAIGLVAVRRPGIGSALLFGSGVIGGGWWFAQRLADDIAPLGALLVTLVVMLVPVLATAALLIVDARQRTRREGRVRPSPTWRSAALVGVPLAGLAAVASQQLPGLLRRHDDGLRGARIIQVGDARLVWAPQGPGWNARSPAGAALAWTELAGSGRASPGRCALLDETGSTLLDRAAGIWRLPTVEEIVGALSRNGVSAGCVWDGRSPHATCEASPDKETPLWAPDAAPIYYWSDHEASPGRALAVNYTGGISPLSASATGVAVGFRCVKPEGP